MKQNFYTIGVIKFQGTTPARRI